MKEEGRGGGSELGSDMDMKINPDPDPWKISWIRIRQNYADPLDPDPQHCFSGARLAPERSFYSTLRAYIVQQRAQGLHRLRGSKLLAPISHLAVAVDVGLPDHLVDLLHGELLAQVEHHIP